MAKVTKTMLKGIVKECLVEILSEGLGDTETMVESVKRAPKRKVQKSKSIFDQMDEAFEKKSQSSGNPTFDSRVDQVASVATSDPVLQSILADTARTTLQEQMKHEPRVPSHTSMPMQHNMPSPAVGPEFSGGAAAGLDINSLFGEATRNWGEVLERTERKLP
jgi:hypothetical protein